MSIQFAQSVADLRSEVVRLQAQASALESRLALSEAKIRSQAEEIETLRTTIATAAIVATAPRKAAYGVRT